jgi:hypothetical protein
VPQQLPPSRAGRSRSFTLLRLARE